jgi:hypothetical protein
MNYRAALRRSAGDNTGSSLSSDLSMDPTMQDAHDPASTVPHGTDPVHTDGADPATPGGASPYNGAEPFGQPAVDDPLWRDPSQEDTNRGGPIPHIEDDRHVDRTTLHNARMAGYQAMADRYGSR